MNPLSSTLHYLARYNLACIWYAIGNSERRFYAERGIPITWLDQLANQTHQVSLLSTYNILCITSGLNQRRFLFSALQYDEQYGRTVIEIQIHNSALFHIQQSDQCGIWQHFAKYKQRKNLLHLCHAYRMYVFSHLNHSSFT